MSAPKPQARPPRVMMAEETESFRRLWTGWLKDAGFEIAAATDGNGARPSVLVAGSGCGMHLLHEMRARGVPVIFAAHASTEQVAIAALRAGCSEYLRVPFSAADLISAVERVCPRASQVSREPSDGMVGQSLAMQNLGVQVQRVARVRSNVLITGETGTGKELVAQAIHRHSERASRRLISVNCAAIPDALVESELFGYERGAFTGAAACHAGKIELADSGTVFLDEVGDMSLTAQAKILRVIESRELYRLGGCHPVPVNVRILAATHCELEQIADRGLFRRDLLFRLSVVRIHLPPLRERRDDIKAITQHYIQELNRELDTGVEALSDELWENLIRYSWPGNVRELRNTLESILVQATSPIISFNDVPAEIRARLTCQERGDERSRLLGALEATKWNKSKAADRLHWSRMTLYRKMIKYSVHPSRSAAKAASANE